MNTSKNADRVLCRRRDHKALPNATAALAHVYGHAALVQVYVPRRCTPTEAYGLGDPEWALAHIHQPLCSLT